VDDYIKRRLELDESIEEKKREELLALKLASESDGNEEEGKDPKAARSALEAEVAKLLRPEAGKVKRRLEKVLSFKIQVTAAVESAGPDDDE
jgi:hypothetical protein